MNQIHRDTLHLKVAKRTLETEDIVSLELRHPTGDMLPMFSAGAHIDVHVAPGMVRQYSLCNAPAERDRYVIGVLNDPASRGGSRAIFTRIREGDELEVSLPRNHFPLRSYSRAVLIAGGIGVTPMLSMAEALQAAGTEFTMHYCVRSRGKAAFKQRIESSPFVSSVHLHCDDEEGHQRFEPEAVFGKTDRDTDFYVCGPSGFIEWIRDSAEAAGIPTHRVRFEYFNAKEVDTSEDGAFEVQVSSTGQILFVPSDRSVADVLIEAGADLHVSCAEGTCGSCVTRILDGVPDHRDVFLTDEEHASCKVFTPCCSRSKSPLLILDL